MAAGEHGETLCSAMAQSNRDESYACAAALRLLRDRRGLSIHICVTSLSSHRSTSVVRPSCRGGECVVRTHSSSCTSDAGQPTHACSVDIEMGSHLGWEKPRAPPKRDSGPELQSIVYRVCKTATQIKTLWERNRIEAASRGTWMHLQLEPEAYPHTEMSLAQSRKGT
jgi:hypothetical protein